jgi:sugar lactone lactonase YvrE
VRTENDANGANDMRMQMRRMTGTILFGVVVAALGFTACHKASDNCTGEAGTICTWAGTDETVRSPEGTLRAKTSLYFPAEIEFSPDGTPYIADWNNHRVIRFEADDRLHVVVGAELPGDGPLDGSRADWNEPGAPGDTVAINHPTDVAFDPLSGLVYMAIWHNHKVRRYDPATDLVYVECGRGQGFAGDGLPVDGDTRMRFPSAVTFGPDGTLYVVDGGNDRIRSITPDGVIDTFAGDGLKGFNGDGLDRLATRFSFPLGTSEDSDVGGALELGPDGNLYVADYQNHRIRMIDMTSGVVTTVAGTYLPPTDLTAFPPEAGAFSGDGGAAIDAELNFPRDIAFAPDGNLYLSDRSNDRIRMVDMTTGTITTVVGTGVRGFSGDTGSAAAAELNQPAGIAFGPDGNLYIADQWNHVIRKVELDL